MTNSGQRSGGVGAAELMAQLAKDQEYWKAAAGRESELQERVSMWREAERPIIEDLRRAGVYVTSVWDLVNTAEPYPTALPVLVEHLERGGYPDRVTEGVARALAVQPARVYWQRLRDLYVQTAGRDAAEGLAVALAASATSENLNDLLGLLGDESRGSIRIHFIRPTLRVGGCAGDRLSRGSGRTRSVGRKQPRCCPQGVVSGRDGSSPDAGLLGVDRDPGPLNREPWAGAFGRDVP